MKQKQRLFAWWGLHGREFLITRKYDAIMFLMCGREPINHSLNAFKNFQFLTNTEPNITPSIFFFLFFFFFAGIDKLNGRKPIHRQDAYKV